MSTAESATGYLPLRRSAHFAVNPFLLFPISAITRAYGDSGDLPPPATPRLVPVRPRSSRGYPGLVPTDIPVWSRGCPGLSRAISLRPLRTAPWKQLQLLCLSDYGDSVRFRAIPAITAIYKGQAQPANCQLLFAQWV